MDLRIGESGISHTFPGSTKRQLVRQSDIAPAKRAASVRSAYDRTEHQILADAGLSVFAKDDSAYSMIMPKPSEENT
jgi:hypothetical protein